MTKHLNEIVPVESDVVAAIVADVLALPEMEGIHNLNALYDVHEAEFAAAQRLFKQVANLQQKAKDRKEAKDATQRVHNSLAEKCRDSEDANFELAMADPNIANFRAELKARTEPLIRERVKKALMGCEKYAGWCEELGVLQSELDAFPGEIEKIEQQSKMVGAEAQGQALKAGAILEEIAELEKTLNA